MWYGLRVCHGIFEGCDVLSAAVVTTHTFRVKVLIANTGVKNRSRSHHNDQIVTILTRWVSLAKEK
jgi:hypothetical protein